jgi:hypothetical protein
MKKYLTTFALIFIVAIINLPVYAGFNEGVKALEKGDYSAALNELRPLAK